MSCASIRQHASLCFAMVGVMWRVPRAALNRAVDDALAAGALGSWHGIETIRIESYGGWKVGSPRSEFRVRIGS